MGQKLIALKNDSVSWNLQVDSYIDSYWLFKSIIIIDGDTKFENEIYINSDDLVRLKSYFLNHINQGTDLQESCTFVTHSLDFQIKALYGWTNEEKSEGEFPVQIFLQIGQTETSGRYYIGVESELNIQSVYGFIDQVDKLLKTQI